MVEKIKSMTIPVLVTVLATLAFAVMAALPASAQFDGPPNIQGNLDQGSCLSTDSCDAPDADGESVNRTIGLIVNIFSWVVGVVAVIMIIWGGFKYITSGGESNNVTAAKNTILYAIIGLIIVALAQVIVRFVLGTFTEG